MPENFDTYCVKPRNVRQEN